MKSKELRSFFNSLSRLNNSLTHYTFVWNQFIFDYGEMIRDNPNKTTSNHFTNNAFAKSHNIRFSVLNNEHENTNRALLEGVFLLVHSNYEQYLKSLLVFARQVNSELPALEEACTNQNDSILFDKIMNRLNLKKDLFPVEILVSLDYIRLLRNRLTHKNSLEISRTLRELISTHGNQLDSYWNNHLPSNLQGICFASKDCNDISFKIIIDTINIFRLVAKNIDTIVLEHLGIDNILRNVILPELIIHFIPKNRNVPTHKLEKKLRKYCLCNYALELSGENLDLILENVA